MVAQGNSAARSQGTEKQEEELDQFRAFIGNAPGEHSYVVLLGLREFDWSGLSRLVSRGLPYEAIEHLHRNTALSMESLLEWLRISARTLTRRKQQGLFLPEESDRLLRASRVFGRALELFEGDRSATAEWLFSAQPALGGESPIEVARTELGSREVENLVGRIEHGVYS